MGRVFFKVGIGKWIVNFEGFVIIILWQHFGNRKSASQVYLTRNGHVEYGIFTMEEIDELDRYKAAYTLFYKLQKADERADKEGWIDADDLEKELGVSET